MQKLILKSNSVLWIIGEKTWLLSIAELTAAYISGKNPHTREKLSTAVKTKMLVILKIKAGAWWPQRLKTIKTYKPFALESLKSLKTTGTKLGKGKYGTVYSLDGYAIKSISHTYYSGLPRIDGSVEASILNLLKKVTYSYASPNIIQLYQYTKDSKTDYLVLEKLSKTFWTYLQENPTEFTVKGIILQVVFTLQILQYLYPGFRHNDLKVDNILLDYTPRNQDVYLCYKTYSWKLPANIPLVKIADYDYAYVPNICSNPKVGTKYSRSFGCTKKGSKIYDVHVFLNSVYSYRRLLSEDLNKWLIKQLPRYTRGYDDSGVKFGRLRNPSDWVGVINTPYEILSGNLFSEFRTPKKEYPWWGIAN